MTLKFAKKLPTLGIHHKAIPDPEPTLPEGVLPDLPDPTRGIDASLVSSTKFCDSWMAKYTNGQIYFKDLIG